MSDLPHSKTFPGTVRIVDRGPKLGSGAYEFPVSVTPLRDAKGKFLGTKVEVPAGADLTYTQEHGRPGELPRHDVSVIRFVAAKPIDTDAEAAKAKELEAAKATLAKAHQDVLTEPMTIEPKGAGEPSAEKVYREDLEEGPTRKP